MRPLSMIQQVLVWLCIHPFREKMHKWKKCTCVAFSLSGFIVNLCTVISSVAFFLKTVSVNFEESLYTLMQICPFISVVNVTITAFFLRNRIGEMFEKLFNIYETGKCFFDHENMNVRISTKFVFLKRKTMIHSDFSWKRMIKVNGFYVSM